MEIELTISIAITNKNSNDDDNGGSSGGGGKSNENMKFQQNRFSLNFHHAWSYGYRLLKESVYIIKKKYLYGIRVIFFFIIISQLNVPLKRIRSYTEFQEETKRKKKKQNPMKKKIPF